MTPKKIAYKVMKGTRLACDAIEKNLDPVSLIEWLEAKYGACEWDPYWNLGHIHGKGLYVNVQIHLRLTQDLEFTSVFEGGGMLSPRTQAIILGREV